ncbi:MAG: hypothetical protein AAF909_14090 [Pseudomonadota bacterium]
MQRSKRAAVGALSAVGALGALVGLGAMVGLAHLALAQGETEQTPPAAQPGRETTRQVETQPAETPTPPASSSIAPDACVQFFAYELGGGWACPGRGGYSLAVFEQDLRMGLDIVHRDWRQTARIPLRRISQSFSTFPEDRVTWIGPAEGPTAMMIEMGFANVEDPGQPDLRYTLAIRLDAEAPERTCLVAAEAHNGDPVAARARANAVVRRDREIEGGEAPCLYAEQAQP